MCCSMSAMPGSGFTWKLLEELPVRRFAGENTYLNQTIGFNSGSLSGAFSRSWPEQTQRGLNIQLGRLPVNESAQIEAISASCHRVWTDKKIIASGSNQRPIQVPQP